MSIPSPCTNVCTLDGPTGWCRGCGRSIDEIAGWTMMDEAARAGLVARLPDRMDQLSRSRASSLSLRAKP